jgi:hypothetical protein
VDYLIYQEDTIWVSRNGDVFLTVKRKEGWKTTSSVFLNEHLILKSTWSATIAFVSIKIREQHLPDTIELQKRKGKFLLVVNQQELYIKLRYFKRPQFLLYKNGHQVGSVHYTKLITLGYGEYRMQTETNDQQLDLYFLLLFIMQLSPIN